MKRYFIYIMTAMLSLVMASCVEEQVFQPSELDNENCWDFIVENNGTYEDLFDKIYDTFTQ